MWLKSHRWVDVPGTRTEKRWAMNVRESTHTAMVFDKKYFNVETGKLDTDKLCTLNHFSLNDFVSEEDPTYNMVHSWERYKESQRRKKAKKEKKEKNSNVYNFPKHVPKDNGFDEEIKRDNERKISQERSLVQQQQKQYAEARLREHNRIMEERRIQLAKEQEEYAIRLAEIESRLMKERDERNERLKQAAYSRHVGNVRPNIWRPK